MPAFVHIPNKVVGTNNIMTNIVIPKAYSNKPLLSWTYYKKNTSVSGVGTVSNSRMINKKT
jgi:hypothetical protein